MGKSTELRSKTGAFELLLRHLCRASACFSIRRSSIRGARCVVCCWSFQFAEGKTERLRMYPRGGRAAVTELSCSRLLEGRPQVREQSQKSEETYFALLILSIVLNEGHSGPKAHLCMFTVFLAGRRAAVTGGGDLCMCGKGNRHKSQFWFQTRVTCQPFVVIWQFLCRRPVARTASSVDCKQAYCLHHAHDVRQAQLGCTAPIADHDLWMLSTVCDLFINCDLVMNDFSRQILIKSSVTSLGLKQMSISN